LTAPKRILGNYFQKKSKPKTVDDKFSLRHNMRISYFANCVCFCTAHFVMVPLNLTLSALSATCFALNTSTSLYIDQNIGTTSRWLLPLKATLTRKAV